MIELIRDCENNQSLISEIKKYVGQKKGLDQFTGINFVLSVNCSDERDSIFQDLLRTKMLAHTMLNMYYNESYYENCSLYEDLIDDVECNVYPRSFPKKVSPNIEELTATILRYVVLFRLLATREGNMTKLKSNGICRFCDNKLGEVDTECSICLAEVDPPDSDSNVTSSDSDDSQRSDETRSKWNCSICTYSNKLSDERCDVCMKDRFVDDPKYIERGHQIEKTLQTNSDDDNNLDTNISISGKQIPVEVWTCPSCTMKNTVENLYCEACFTTREQQTFVVSCQDCHRPWNLPWSPETHQSLLRDWICEDCFHEGHVERSTTDSDWIVINLDKCIKKKRTFNHEYENSLSTSIPARSISSVDYELARDWVQIKTSNIHFSDTLIEGDNQYMVEENVYCCNNRTCSTVNGSGILHSCKCASSSGPNVTEFNVVDVMDGEKSMRFWECTLCGKFSQNNNNTTLSQYILCSLL